MPLTMVTGRFLVTIATMAATSPATHSLGPPESSDTAARETIREPGKARNARAQAPSFGIRCPMRTPDRRIAKVPAARASMTNQVSCIADDPGHSGARDAAEYQRP